MPPHPELVEKMEQEGKPLPDLTVKYGIGVDRPRQFPVPPSGNFNLLVVAVDFSDNANSVPANFFDSLIFSQPGPPPTGPGSVMDYYFQISYGSFTLVTLNLPGATGWQRAPNPYNGLTGYVNADGVGNTADDYGWGSYPQNLQGIVADVLPIIDPQIDFSQYDNDGDGFVESIVFVHAGPGAEISGSPSDIWSSAWDMTSNNGPGPLLTQDGVWVDNFTFDPEYMYWPGDQTIGVYCHELGHTLFGLPDLYDYDLSSHGVGNWSLMSYGSWNGVIGLGESPSWPDAWSRIQMGFDFPMEIDGSAVMFPFPAVETGPGLTVKLKSPQLGPKEYFLLEYRDPSAPTPFFNFDWFLPGSGLLIWHIDEDKWNWWELNTYECGQHPCCAGSCTTWHPLVALEQADGNLDLEQSVVPPLGNYGDAGDPYPGTSNNPAFRFGTTPESGSYYANPCPSDSCVSLQNISGSIPGLIFADVDVACLSPSACVNFLPDNQVGWGQSGTDTIYRVTVQNCSNVFEFAVTIDIDSDWDSVMFNWGTRQPMTQTSMFPGGAWYAGITVTVPSDAVWNDTGVLTMTALSGNDLTYSHTEKITTTVPYCTLVVDDDKGTPDVDGVYTNALANGNYNYDYWDMSLWGEPGQDTLNAHDTVVWFTGAPRVDTISPLNERSLAHYLDGGGDLFLSSQDYLYDVGRSAFNREYLRVLTYTEDITTSVVTGITGNPLGDGLGPYTLSTSSVYADEINPIPPASGAFTGDTGFVNTLTNDAGGWQSAFLAWPFENLAQTDADELMGAAMSWFDIPVVSFTPSTSIVCVGETITFTNTSSGSSSFLWDFGDGVTSTLTDTAHVYLAPITTSVELMGFNSCGNDLDQQMVSIYQIPVAEFIPSATNVLVNESITFNNNSSGATVYLWDFGDGVGTSTETSPTYAYSSVGTYQVTMTASNPGCGDVVSQQINVTDFYRIFLPFAVEGSQGVAVNPNSWGGWGQGLILAFISLLTLGFVRWESKSYR
jgi:M6 family metalloprotease-like protein